MADPQEDYPTAHAFANADLEEINLNPPNLEIIQLSIMRMFQELRQLRADAEAKKSSPSWKEYPESMGT